MPSLQDPCRFNHLGNQIDDRAVSVYFAPAGETVDGVTSEGFSKYEIQRFKAVVC